MHNRHLAHWPPALPQHLTVPATNLYYNVEVAAARFPDKPFLLYYDTPITFRTFHEQTLNIAGYLQQVCGVKKGDRVLLYLQNSPQFMLAYYGILRADAVVVPVNPMNLGAELQYMVEDTGARTAFVAQDLLPAIAPLLGHGLTRLIAVTYADYLTTPTTQAIPAVLATARIDCNDDAITPWRDMLAAALMPAPLACGPEDLCVMPYTSGTTGHPKGCMHTHRSVMYNAVAGAQWFAMQPDTVVLSVLPLFHVTGMQGTMNGPLYVGCTVVVLPRWDADAAAQLVERHRISVLHLIATMVIDFLANPRINEYDLRSVQTIRGGGAAMPEAVAQQLQTRLGLAYIEGYGMSETIAPTHLNPPGRAKPQCLGMPIFDVDARVIDPESFTEMTDGDVGEIIVHGPQVMQGYWNNPAANSTTFIDIDGKRFLRTGDLGRVDEDGYFFMVDRLKRMINSAGFKVWPAEVEAMMYQHPAIQEVCIYGMEDTRRGQSVTAAVVLKKTLEELVTEQAIIDWTRLNMAAYKTPRRVFFMEALPKSGTGKIQWRALQESFKKVDSTT